MGKNRTEFPVECETPCWQPTQICDGSLFTPVYWLITVLIDYSHDPLTFLVSLFHTVHMWEALHTGMVLDHLIIENFNDIFKMLSPCIGIFILKKERFLMLASARFIRYVHITSTITNLCSIKSREPVHMNGTKSNDC